jgi:membrane-bound lytic murein transglycosylase MltF
LADVRSNSPSADTATPLAIPGAVPDNLEDEDLLEMVNAGLLSTTIVNDNAAKLWNKLFIKLQLHSNISVNTGGEFA